MESVWKPNVEISPNCPRCGSSNTKFCYYNNYSLTQPRYFCKGCRRYWTKGGSLRNVPVGGGCRKNRRSNNNKALRQSIDGLNNFKNSPPNCGGGSDAITNSNNNQIIGHCYDPRRTNNNSSSSSIVADGPNIDLALVYANFLNQKPANSGDGDVVVVENSEHHQIHQQVFDPSIESSSRLSNIEGGPIISTTNLHEEFGLINGCLNLPQQQPPHSTTTTQHNFGEGNSNINNSNNNNNNNKQIMYLSELNSIHMHHHDHQKGNNNRIIIDEQSSSHDDSNNNNNMNNFELPPLPSCDEVEALSHDDDLLWSNPMMLNNHHNHAFHQQTQPPLFGTQEEIHDNDDDAELLIGNWCPFDLPKDDASFSRP